MTRAFAGKTSESLLELMHNADALGGALQAFELMMWLIASLLGVIIALLVYLWRNKEKQYEIILQKLDRAGKQPHKCMQSFATKEGVARAHLRIDEQEAAIGNISGRVSALEARSGIRRGSGN